MYKSSFLDPRFKTLTHLSLTAKQEIFDWVLEDILNLNNDNESNHVQIECVTTTESSEPSTSSSSDCNGPTRKKKKKSALMELIGDKFQSENEQTTDTTTFKDIVHSERLRYRGVAKGGQGGAFAPPSLNDFFFKPSSQVYQY